MTLIISFLSKFPDITNIKQARYKYVIGTCHENPFSLISINDQGRLNDIAIEQKALYSDWIYSLNKKYIEEGLIYDDDLSLYFLSDLSCKRNDQLPTYDEICNILLISELVVKYRIEEIYIFGGSRAFCMAFSSLITVQKIEYIGNLNLLFNDNLLKYAHECIKFFFKYLIISFLNVIIYPRINTVKKKYSRLYLTRFPHMFTSPEKYVEDKYGDLKNKSERYLVSFLSDGIHQNISLYKYFRYRKELGTFPERFLFLDDCARISQVLRAFINLYRLYPRFNRMQKKIYYFNGINITGYIKYELALSFSRTSRLLLCLSIFRTFLKKININEFVYYLHEYPYGRMISYALKSEYEIKKIGMQHGPTSLRLLLYSMTKKEALQNGDYINHAPIPDTILAEDLHSKYIYELAGYQNVLVLAQVPRYRYLLDIRREYPGKYILIVPGQHDGALMLNYLKSDIIKTKNQKYLFKPHPRSSNEYIKEFIFENLEITNLHIKYLLGNASEIYVTYSSVGWEAFLFGIPVKTIDIPGKVNKSPLLDIGSYEK